MSARTILTPPLNQLNAVLSSSAQAESPTNLFVANITASGFVNGNNLNVDFITDSTGSTGTEGQFLTVGANGKIVWTTQVAMEPA